MRLPLCSLVLAIPLQLGCKPELPPLEYRSERARVGSDLVDQVCEGTLARIDREIEIIEERLELPVTSSAAKIYIVDRDVANAYCTKAVNCMTTPGLSVIITPTSFDTSITHELTHFRVSLSSDVLDTTVFFREGIAVALGHAYCPRHVSSALTVWDLLNAGKASSLSQMGGYYVAGEFVAWMLDTYGGFELLMLMKTLRRRGSVSEVRRKYRERFGVEIDEDIFAHFREPGELSLEELGCTGPAAPADEDGQGFVLQADMNCYAEDVQNNFFVDGGGYVEWILTLDEEQSGSYRLVGDVPEFTILTIEQCQCRPNGKADPYLLPRAVDGTQHIAAGNYRLRWNAQLDSGAALNVKLVRQ